MRRRKSRMSVPLSRMRPRVGIVKARHQVGHRRLPGAAAAHQRDHRSAGHGDVEVAHHRPALAIFELDVLELDLVHDARRVARVGPVGLVVLHRQHFEHALHRRQRPLQLGEGIDDVPDRVQQQERVPLERHDVADRGAADDVQVAAVPDDHDVDAGDQQAPRRPQHQLAAMREQLLAQHGVPPAHVVEQLAHFPPERPDDANARERLADAAVDLFHVLANRAVDRPDAPRRDEAHQHRARDDGQRHQRQPPVQRQQHADGDDQPDERDRRARRSPSAAARSSCPRRRSGGTGCRRSSCPTAWAAAGAAAGRTATGAATA